MRKVKEGWIRPRFEIVPMRTVFDQKLAAGQAIAGVRGDYSDKNQKMRQVWNRARSTKRVNGQGYYEGVLDRYDNDPGTVLDGKRVTYADTVKHMPRWLAAQYDEFNNNRIMDGGGHDKTNPNARSVRDILAQYGGGHVIPLQNKEAIAGLVTGGAKQSPEFGEILKDYRKRAADGEDMKGKGSTRNWSQTSSAANAAHKQEQTKLQNIREPSDRWRTRLITSRAKTLYR